MRHPRRISALLAVSAATALALAPAASAQKVTSQRIITGLSAPTYLTHAGDGSGRLFILEQSTARIEVYDSAGGFLATFLDIGPLASGGGERGLLGLAFHPDYATNGDFFVHYTDNAGDTVVARGHVSGDPTTNNVADAAVDTIFTTPQPFSNHNGGWIEFGPDGFLYISLGDGGSGGDPGNRAQTTTNLKGKMLRVDVDTDDFPLDPDSDYGIPNDNVYAPGGSNPGGGAEEVYDIGLRNAWRCAFDRETGDLWIADVGQNVWEEIDFRPAGTPSGVNWGWRLKEGFACFNPSSNCDPGGITTDPIHVYSHGGSPFRCSITGGYPYRGTAIPGLQGAYFYADYCSDQIWYLRYDADTDTVLENNDVTSEIAPPLGVINSPTSFGQDEDGELYIVDGGGEIYKIMPDLMVLAVPQMTGGQPVTMDVTKATPGRKVFYGAGKMGTGVNLNFLNKLNGALYILQPAVVGTDIANAGGMSSLTLDVPAAASGLEVWLQAAEKGNVSNVVNQIIN